MIRRLNQEERNELIRIFDENGYDVIDIEKLSFELEEQGATYIGDKDDIIDQWCDLMGIDIPTEFLDEDGIIDTIERDSERVKEARENIMKAEVEEKEAIINRDGQIYVTEPWANRIARVLLLSDKTVPKEDRLDKLVKQLMDLFPKGKKEGTSVYWKGNLKDNKLKLQKFFKLYGNTYTDEQIITATKKYVESFNGNYAYMRALKYFIWKDEKKVGADGKTYVEEVSDLASYIENEDQVNTTNDGWTAEFR